MTRLLLLVVLLTSACATHNSHRVPIDLNADLATLIDEAWTNMEAAWNAPVPVGGVPVAVGVEKVDVQWLPFSPEVPPGSEVIPQAGLAAHIQEALRTTAEPTGSNAELRVRVGLAADLHEPDVLGIQVECDLLAATDPERVLAHGGSTIVRFPRLYCHGCRDRWGGHGTRLRTLAVAGGAATVDLGVFFCWPSSSSSGYTKN
ncbi:MAG TPA: hypothetical protein VF530_21575 [Planctomycetota bacterium]